MEIRQQTAPPQFLYKYIDWENENHKKNLTHNELFFSSVDKFNDPFDSSIPVRFDLATDDEHFQLAKDYLRMQEPYLSNELMNKKAEIMVGKARRFINSSNYYNESTRRQRKGIAEDYGIFSTSKNNDEILLWSHYANKHTGLCLRINSNKLIELLKTEFVSKGIKLDYDEVTYKDKPPVIDATKCNDYLDVFYVKSQKWAYEEEYRFILRKANQKVYHTKGIIDQVILGVSSDKHKGEIVKLCIEKKIEMKKAIMDNGNFTIKIIDF